MIHIDYNPQTLPEPTKTEWETLLADYETATLELITKWEAEGKLVTKDFDAQFWSRLKKFLLEHIFNNKCAYCETDLGAARQPGDADHYRPKGLVNYKTKPEPEWKKYKRARTADYRATPPNELNHPGYFWLAYNWKNLLPACKDCNSGQGKLNQFPVIGEGHLLNLRLSPAEAAQLNGKYFQSPTDPEVFYLDVEDLNAREQPALLHPYFDPDPAEHLEFTPDGRVLPRTIGDKESKLGKESISAYDLWDENLRQAREKAQIEAENKYLMAYIHFHNQGLSRLEALQAAKTQDVTIDSIFKKKVPYSAAVIDYLTSWTLSIPG